MSFDASLYLGQATSRAKSDVANKLISMFLHEISRRLVSKTGLAVKDLRYTQAVKTTFGNECSYCARQLEKDRVAIEHADGMNRFRVGLHVPGNVILSCKKCNGEKRRDDSLQVLVLGATGWESFLSHDGKACAPKCKTCSYWASVWPDPFDRSANLQKSLANIGAFRLQYQTVLEWSAKLRPQLRDKMESLYRDCQGFATDQITTAADALWQMHFC